MTIIWYQLAAVIGAVILQCGLVGLALAVGKRFWALAYLVIIAILSGLFSLLAFFSLLTPATLLVLILSLFGIRYLYYNLKGAPGLLGGSARISLAVLLVDFLYAAFPDYRYDQWSYHLLVGKQIVRGGQLSTPILYDHIYFSGIYEYLTVIPRLFWDDDIFAHCFSNAFSYLAFVLPFCGLIYLFVDEYKLPRRLTVLMACAFFFSIPDHEVLLSSKPDSLLIAFGFAGFYTVVTRKITDTWRYGLLAFFLIAPVAFKLTYIHFAVSMVVGFATLVLFRRMPIKLSSLTVGAAGGILVTVPYFFKNIKFFGNPVHPIQAGFLNSLYWGSDFDRYWKEVSGRASSLKEYVTTLINLPESLLQLGIWFIALAVILSIVCVKARRNAQYVKKDQLMMTTVCICFVLLWPLLFGDHIFARFLYPIIGLFVVLAMNVMSRSHTLLRLAAVLMIPVVLNSSMEVKLFRMQSAFASADAYFNNGRMPHKHYLIDQEVNAHKQQHFPAAGYGEKRVLTDSAIGYFLDSERLDYGSPDYHYHLARVSVTGKEQNSCIWDLVDELDIRYLRTIYRPFSDWPNELQTVITAAKNFGTVGGLRYLDDATIAARRLECHRG